MRFGVVTTTKHTYNIGDDIQSLAAIHVLKKFGIIDYITIDREALNVYDGEPVTLIMNGWYMHDISSFPPAKQITPIFISFHCANEKLIVNNVEYFRKYAPIGCRDAHTLSLCKKYNIDAYFSGCLTLCFDESEYEKGNDIYFVDVDMPYKINEKYTNIYHNISDKKVVGNLESRHQQARDLIEKYKKAKLVVTTRLHCALPCRAFGTDVIFLHKDYNVNKRFSGLHHILEGSTNGDDSKITVDRTNIELIRKGIYDVLSNHINKNINKNKDN